MRNQQETGITTSPYAVGIAGAGYYVPSKILTNAEIGMRIGIPDEWVRTRTGIRERRIAANEEATSDLAVRAGLAAMKSASITPDQVDLIIVATLSPDMQFPATACIVQEKLGCKRAAAFDVGAACSGFIFALSIAEQYMKSGTYSTVLVIGAEVFSRIIDWEDRNTCVLFGDGAGAIVVRRVEPGTGIISISLGSDGSGAELLKIPAGGSRQQTSYETVRNRLYYIKMAGKEIYKFATNSVVMALRKELARQHISCDDISLLICHQANVRIIERIAGKLSLPMDKVFVNIDKYGNTSAASIPIALCDAILQGKIHKGDIVVFIGLGAGLTWGSAIVKWT